MGLEPYGWKILFANDISSKKYGMYQDFFPDAQLHYKIGDIFDLDLSEIPITTLATCSFPCIDLSLAGNMNGIVNGNHSSAFWGFIKILKAQKNSSPPLVLVENVPGWLYSNNGGDFRLTIQSLNELGYFCDVFVLDALRFSPQSRSRVFLIGSKKTGLPNSLSMILERPKSLITNQVRKSLETNKDLLWSYNEIPEPPPLFKSGLSKVVERLDASDEKWWSSDLVSKHLEMMPDLHRERVEKLKLNTNLSFRAFYRRRREDGQKAEVRDDDLSGCLRTAIGGSGKQFLIQAGKGHIKMRQMTPREYARLQGVPDKYRISKNGVQALTGFGDAVCVPVISWIAENVLNQLVADNLSTST